MCVNDDLILARVARHHVREGRLQQAESLVTAWQQRVPGAAAPLALQSLTALLSGDLEQAKNLAQQAVARDSRLALAYFSLAQIYLAEDRQDDALTGAQKAIQLDPSDSEVACFLAHLHLQRGQLDQAEHLLRRTVEAQADPYAKLALAELLLNHARGELGEVEQLAREVYTHSPHIASAWALHGLAVASSGDLVLGRSRLEFALALEPDQPAFLLPLVQVALSEADSAALERAVTLARRATALAPYNWRAPSLLSQALRMQRQHLESMKVLAAAAKDFPQQPELLLGLARTCVDIAQFDAAIEALDKARTLAAPQTDLLGIQFELHMRRGDMPSAVVAIEELDAIERSGGRRLPALDDVEAGQILGVMGRGLAQYLAYVRFLPALKQKMPGVRVKLAAAPRFAALMARIPGVDEVSVDEQFGANWVEPLQRLPALLGVSAETVLFDGPYINASQAAHDQARAERAAIAGPCVLVDLGSSPDAALVRHLGHWLRQSAATAVVLSPIDAWQTQKENGLRVISLDAEDLEMVAGWALLVDAVLAGDVPLAHLAGGLGVSANVFLPLGHDPLWGVQAETSWYPFLRLYREPLAGGWELAWAAIEASLREHTAFPVEPVSR